MSRRIWQHGKACLSVVEKVLLSERNGLTIYALLGRTPDGWVAGWLVLGGEKRIKVQPAVRPGNKPQDDRDTALALALAGALKGTAQASQPLDWRQASLLKQVLPRTRMPGFRQPPSPARPS
ncbi:hypothetical protein [Geopseudomonas aromaticivorans]